MATQDNKTSNGWPLGLEIMNMRLGAMEDTTQATQTVEPHARTVSFSSFSSSNLDTESTASFFQDNSVSLGRLIGFKDVNGGRLYIAKGETIGRCACASDVSKGHSSDLSHGICIPLMMKMSRTRSRSKPRV